jgi:hypothetical protein
MSTRIPAQGAAQGRGPQDAPETPRKRGDGAAINDLVRQLRDKLGLAIAPRDLFYSPSQHKSPADALYDRVKSLYWKERVALYATIEECRSDFERDLSVLSAEQRTNYVFEKLHDLAWFSTHRIPRPLPRASSTLTRTMSDPQPTQRLFRRVDSRAETPSPSTPTSPPARKTIAGNADKSQTNARDSFWSRGSFASNDTTANTSLTSSFASAATDADEGFYGSSIPFSQVEDPTAGSTFKIHQGHVTRSITPTPKQRQTSPKRKRPDEIQDLTETPMKKVKQEPQQLTGNATKLSESHWQLKNLARDGLGLDTIEDFDGFWKSPLATQVKPPAFCSAQGSISINVTNKGPLLQTKVNPLCPTSESSRAQRYFGSDRIMTLNAPSFTKNLPRHIGGNDEDEARCTALAKWLGAPKHFLGRQWWMFQIGEVDRSKVKKRQADKCVIRPLSLFAVEGTGLSTKVSLFEFLNQWIPFEENASQPVCKISARIPLSTKQSTPSICFRPTQIRMFDDIKADGVPEDTRFNDPAFIGMTPKVWEKDEVMTDGCASISVGAAREIRKRLGIQEWPAAFQGRINGAKGMWNISAPYSTSDPDHTGIWIEIRESQLKVKPRKEDWDPVRCEEDRWCFDVKNYSRPAKPSHLHKDFLSVLEDRHVPRANIIAMVKEGVDTDIKELREMLGSPAKLALWRHRNFPIKEDQADRETLGLPRTSAGKARLFMEQTGYTIYENVHAAESFEWMLEKFIQRQREQLRFSCLKSVLLLGLADPIGVLKPGEVHLSLSRPLEDERTREQFDQFAGSDVLIARDPTIRGSDMQKVRCICHPDLSHLKDVVVLPRSGQIPLAAKLQGGDYDGDTFWVCADERLSTDFLNAPVLSQRGIEFFDIRQEKRKLGEIVESTDLGTDEHAKALLATALLIACQDNPLGYITSYCNSLSYDRRFSQGLWDRRVMMIADLHDLIIDAPKNGYLYSAKDFDTFLERQGLPAAKKLRKREYDVNINAAHNDKAKLLEILKAQPKHKSGHILDEILFTIINVPFYTFLRDFQSNVVNRARLLDQDPDLEYILVEMELKGQSKLPFDLSIEKRALQPSLKEVTDLWHRAWRADNNERRKELLGDCYDSYNAIKPTDPDMYLWSLRIADVAPTYWDCFKLAVFARTKYQWKKKCIFWVARDTVFKVKAQSKRAREVLDQIQEIMKAKKPKEWVRADAFDAPSIGDDVDDEEPEFEDGFDERLFDAF